MRPSLTLFLIIAAVVISIVIGLVLGGGPQVWLTGQGDSSGAVANAALLVATASPTATHQGHFSVIATTATAVPTVATTPTPPPTSTSVLEATAPLSPTATATPDNAPDDAPSVLTLTVASDNVRLRTAPGTASQVILRLNSGTQGVATGRTEANDWVQVEVPEVANGWISADPALVTIEGTVENLPIVEAETAEITQ